MSKKKTTRDEKAPGDSKRREFLGRIGGVTAATIAAGTIAKTTANAQTSTTDCTQPTQLTGACALSMQKAAAEGRSVMVIGRVQNGKVMFDQASLDQFARVYPNADMAFVAYNAPFDPVPHNFNA